jgi:putative hydrolase of the HAD superfamily
MVERPGSNRPADEHEKPMMLKNAVFDLGNVLISFRPSEFLIRKNYPEAYRETILNDIFRSREWHLIDEGVLTVSEAIENILLRSSLERHEILQIFNHRKEILYPIESNIKILPELKKQGFKLYYLSNFPLDMFEDLKNSYELFRFFDGGIISAEVKLAKPDVRIYQTLLEKYGLIAGECLYIDDLEANVRPAESLGMKGIITFGSPDISVLIGEALLSR